MDSEAHGCGQSWPLASAFIDVRARLPETLNKASERAF